LDIIIFTDNEQIVFDYYINNNLNNTKTLFINEIKNSDLKENLLFKRIYVWFKDKLNISFQKHNFSKLQYVFKESNQEFFEIFSKFDIGISDVILKKIPVDNFKDQISTKNYKQIIEEIISSTKEESSFGVKLSNSLYNIKHENNEIVEVVSVSLKHSNSDFTFEFEEESEGTKRLFDLIDILIAPKADSIYIIDEIYRSIHPILTFKYLELFNHYLKSINTQLIFSSHEVNILTPDLLRKDEVWFVEKSINNTSKLFSLDIFKEKHHKKLLSSYLEGAYGAIPLVTRNGEK